MSLEPRPNPLEELDIRPEAAMQELIACYTPMVCRIAGRYLQTAEDIKDVVGATFGEVYARRKNYDPASGSLSTWIGTIARNISVSLYRKNKDFLYYKGDEPGWLGTVDFAEQVQNAVMLERAIAQLSETDQRLIRMKYYGNMTLAEIATFLDLPYETVKKRHTRAIQRLRKVMPDEE